MKSQKGITLISLTIYIIAMTIAIAVVSVISTYFYNNSHSLSDTINPITEYTKFNSFFTDEVNHNNIKILECKTTYKNNNIAEGVESSYVVFDNGVQYTFLSANKGVYRNKVKITRNVEQCTFEQKVVQGKDVINVKLKIENSEEKNVDYTLKK